MFGYRSVRGRCAFDVTDAGLPMEESDAMDILSLEGFRVVEVDMVAKARRCIDSSRYRRGARMVESPGVVDCSSFVKWLYAELGIWLPRRSIQQRRMGADVGPDETMAGDLVFSRGALERHDDGLAGGVGHVALATGAGTVIHAANTGAGVIESPLASLTADGACRGIRRIIPSGHRVLTLACPMHREVETSDDIRWIILQSLPRR
ncbi:MAG: hypothetical protein RL272_1004 [Candidatus Parcubacteria bacterium]|jgi:hypothetical protein